MLIELDDFELALTALETRVAALTAERDFYRDQANAVAVPVETATQVEAVQSERNAALSARIDAIGREPGEQIQQTLVFAR